MACCPQERFEVLVNEVVDRTDHINSAVRQGSQLTLSFLFPASVRYSHSKRLMHLIEKILDVVLRGVADDADETRDASMEAGKSLIATFLDTHLKLFIPKLEEGVFSGQWRTRCSSVQLLGFLLSKCIKEEGEVEENSQVNREQKLNDLLGEETLDKILASFYVIRCDTNATVRQQALVEWRNVVHNPQKTIKRVMPFLMDIVVNCLGSASADLRETGGSNYLFLSSFFCKSKK